MSLAQDITFLKKIPMLSEFADDQLRLLAFSAESVDYQDGQVLFDEGDRADSGLLLTQGAVNLQQRGEDGFKDIDRAETGSLLGESAMLVETRRPCRATAVGEVRVIRIRRALFKRMLMEFPELARRLFDEQAARFSATAGALSPIGDRLSELDQISASRALRGSEDT